MIGGKFFMLVIKQVWRARTRSLLTMGGVMVAMFLFASVQAMQSGVEAATQVQADDITLVVYRKDRYCPFTSRMPQSYEHQLKRIPGVKSVTPIKIVVSNCRTSLDVVTFRGVPKDSFRESFAPRLTFLQGSFEDWARRSDGALLGEVLATRRGLRVGIALKPRVLPFTSPASFTVRNRRIRTSPMCSSISCSTHRAVGPAAS